jgi:hypothetical protein
VKGICINTFYKSGVNIYWLGADENNPDTPYSGEKNSYKRCRTLLLECP